MFAFLSVLSALGGETKFFLTAEHAQRPQRLYPPGRNKVTDILVAIFGVSTEG